MVYLSALHSKWKAVYEIVLGEYVMVGQLEDLPFELSDVYSAFFPMWEAAYEILLGEYAVVGELEELSVER
jgi:hypothetical protein